MGRTNNIRLLFSAGGTGGHILPAIAVADAIKKRWPQTEILFVGAEGRMEMEKVPARGYNIKGLPIRGLQRNLSAKNIVFPVKLLQSLRKAGQIIDSFQPHAAIGFGGYASGPVLKTAQWKRIPTFIQEQNSYPGITNRWLARKSKKIFTAYSGLEKYFPQQKIVITGNPIREDFFHLSDNQSSAKEYYGFDPDKQLVFFMGGSQGSRTINRAVYSNIDYFIENNIQVIWQTGKLFVKEANELIQKHKVSNLIKSFVFIDDIHQAFAAANLVVARAGAISIAELSAAGKACIFVPLPSAAEDHQRKNAQKLVDLGAAEMIEDHQLEQELSLALDKLLKNPQRLEAMKQGIKTFAYPNASENIASEIMNEIIRENG